MAQLMPLPLTVSCASKIQIGFTFLVPAHPGRPGKRAVKRADVHAFNGYVSSSFRHPEKYGIFLMYFLKFSPGGHICVVLAIVLYRLIVSHISGESAELQGHP